MFFSHPMFPSHLFSVRREPVQCTSNSDCRLNRGYRCINKCRYHIENGKYESILHSSASSTQSLPFSSSIVQIVVGHRLIVKPVRCLSPSAFVESMEMSNFSIFFTCKPWYRVCNSQVHKTATKGHLRRSKHVNCSLTHYYLKRNAGSCVHGAQDSEYDAITITDSASIRLRSHLRTQKRNKNRIRMQAPDMKNDYCDPLCWCCDVRQNENVFPKQKFSRESKWIENQRASTCDVHSSDMGWHVCALNANTHTHTDTQCPRILYLERY